MRLSRACCGALLLTLAVSYQRAQGALMFFNNRTDFNMAAPGLPVETFEDNVRPNNRVFLFNEPLNSASNNGSFTPGSILEGVNIGVTAPGTQTLVLLTQGFFGVPSDVVGPNSFANDLELTFGPGIDAVGFDILAPVGAGQLLTVSVFGPGNVLLGSQTRIATAGPSFFGVTSSPDPITRITITDFGAAGELIDNLAFGTAIPEPASLAIFGLAGLAAFGFVRRRGRVTA